MMEFLYFPEDKSEYIPAVITLIIFAIGAAITLYFFLRASKKEAKKTEEQYQEHLKPKEDGD
ncbi:hypothetical protein [Lentibacillus juripiscarius]|uniref:YtzI protein n=1 Tax=Lentibacillus juripiscarius TaxID=257446 RepID=A0ABW5V4R4_9BACI